MEESADAEAVEETDEVEAVEEGATMSAVNVSTVTQLTKSTEDHKSASNDAKALHRGGEEKGRSVRPLKTWVLMVPRS